jgi:hypothetical protein
MKPFNLLKILTLALGFGALMLFAPSCKAQSEVSPDHFDGTDSWEIAARTPLTPKIKLAKQTSSYLAQNKKAGASANLQLAAAREASKSSPRDAVAVQDKRKVAVRKPDQQ